MFEQTGGELGVVWVDNVTTLTQTREKMVEHMLEFWGVCTASICISMGLYGFVT